MPNNAPTFSVSARSMPGLVRDVNEQMLGTATAAFAADESGTTRTGTWSEIAAFAESLPRFDSLAHLVVWTTEGITTAVYDSGREGDEWFTITTAPLAPPAV